MVHKNWIIMIAMAVIAFLVIFHRKLSWPMKKILASAFHPLSRLKPNYNASDQFQWIVILIWHFLLYWTLKLIKYQQADPSLPLQSRRTKFHAMWAIRSPQYPHNCNVYHYHTKARSRNRCNFKLNKEPYLELVGYFPDDHDDKSIRSRLTSQSIRLSGP